MEVDQEKRLYQLRHAVMRDEGTVADAKKDLKGATDGLKESQDSLNGFIDEMEHGAGPLFEEAEAVA